MRLLHILVLLVVASRSTSGLVIPTKCTGTYCADLTAVFSHGGSYTCATAEPTEYDNFDTSTLPETSFVALRDCVLTDVTGIGLRFAFNMGRPNPARPDAQTNFSFQAQNVTFVTEPHGLSLSSSSPRVALQNVGRGVLEHCAFRRSTAEYQRALHTTQNLNELVVKSCSFVRNRLSSRTGGAAMRLESRSDNGFINIEECLFMSNDAIAGGGALYKGVDNGVVDSGVLTIARSSFVHNKVSSSPNIEDMGGSVRIIGSGQSTPGNYNISGCLFKGSNKKSLMVSSAHVFVDACIFQSNGADTHTRHTGPGSGIWVGGSSANIQVLRTSFLSNAVSSEENDLLCEGGAFYGHNDGISVLLESCIFKANKAGSTRPHENSYPVPSDDRGGAVCVHEPESMRITHTSFLQNTVERHPRAQGWNLDDVVHGGALYIKQGNLEVESSLFEENRIKPGITSFHFGGAISMECPESGSGGLLSALITRTSFVQNVVEGFNNPAGVPSARAEGGALYVFHQACALEASVFVGNSLHEATDIQGERKLFGGAVSFRSRNKDQGLNVTGCLFSSNRLVRMKDGAPVALGGAIFACMQLLKEDADPAFAPLDVSDSTFVANAAIVDTATEPSNEVDVEYMPAQGHPVIDNHQKDNRRRSTISEKHRYRGSGGAIHIGSELDPLGYFRASFWASRRRRGGTPRSERAAGWFDVRLTRTVFRQNIASTHGGAVSMELPYTPNASLVQHLRVKGCDFQANRVLLTGKRGDSLFVLETPDVQVEEENNVFAFDMADTRFTGHDTGVVIRGWGWGAAGRLEEAKVKKKNDGWEGNNKAEASPTNGSQYDDKNVCKTACLRTRFSNVEPACTKNILVSTKPNVKCEPGEYGPDDECSKLDFGEHTRKIARFKDCECSSGARCYRYTPIDEYAARSAPKFPLGCIHDGDSRLLGLPRLVCNVNASFPAAKASSVAAPCGSSSAGMGSRRLLEAPALVLRNCSDVLPQGFNVSASNYDIDGHGCLQKDQITFPRGPGGDYVPVLRNVSLEPQELVSITHIFDNGQDGSGRFSSRECSRTLIKHCTFRGHRNTAEEQPGAVFAFGAMTFEACAFESNSAPKGLGAAVLLQRQNTTASGSAVVSGCSFLRNEARRGGAVAMKQDVSDMYSVTIKSTTFLSNRAAAEGGAIYSLVTQSLTPTFKSNRLDDNPHLDLEHCLFRGNTALSGAAVFVRDTREEWTTGNVTYYAVRLSNVSADRNVAAPGPVQVFSGDVVGGVFVMVSSLHETLNPMTPRVCTAGEAVTIPPLHNRTVVHPADLVFNETHGWRGCVQTTLRRPCAANANVRVDPVMSHGGSDDFHRLLSTESTMCPACPSGRVAPLFYRPGLHTWAGCTPCPARYTCRDPFVEPVPCDANPVGTFCPGGTAPEATPCPSGTYSTLPGNSKCRACPAGTFVDTEGSSECLRCAGGKYTAETGQAACAQCPEGKSASLTNVVFDNMTGGMDPADAWGRVCAPFSCPTGFIKSCEDCECKPCTQCSAGTFLVQACSATDTVCEFCPAGRYPLGLDSTNCSACAAGRYQPSRNTSLDGTEQVGCISCPLGRASALTGVEECTDCGAGKFAASLGLESCKGCVKGQFQDERGTSLCKQCAPGHYAGEAAPVCSACAAGTYASDEGQAKCRPCSNPSREYVPTLSGATTCLPCHADAETTPDMLSCQCKPQFFELGLGLDGQKRPNATSDAETACSIGAQGDGCCWPCPEGSSCQLLLGEAEDGSDMIQFEGRLATRPEFWRDSRLDTERTGTGGVAIMRCDIPKACLGTKHLLEDLRAKLGGRNGSLAADAELLNGTVQQAKHIMQCLEGHTGVLCGDCLQNATHLYRPGANKVCVLCEGGDPGNDLKITIFFVVSLAACIFTTKLVLSNKVVKVIVKAQDGDDGGADAQEAAANVSAAASVASRLATAFPYIQRIVAVNDVFVSIQWPPFATAVVETLKFMIARFGTLLALVSWVPLCCSTSVLRANTHTRTCPLLAQPCALHTDALEQMGIALAVMPWTLGVLFGAKLLSRVVLKRRYWLSHKTQRHIDRKAARRKKKKKHGRDQVTEQDAIIRISSLEGKSASPHAGSAQAEIVTVGLVAIGLLCFKLLHPGVSQQLLLIWVCSPPVAGAENGVMRAAVGVKCDMSDPLWPTLVACAVFGTVFMTVGVPLVMAAIVRRDRVKFRHEQTAHAEEEATERDRTMRSLFHVPTPIERIAQRAHAKHASHVVQLETLTHRSVNWFVERYKPAMWWWFLVEIGFSLVFISMLQLVSSSVWTQYYLSLLAATLQILLPALVKPHVKTEDDTMAIIGGVVYFLIVLAQVPRLLVDLDRSVSDEVYALRVTNTEFLIDATFLLSLLGLLGVMFKASLAGPARRMLRACTGRLASKGPKVLPVLVAKNKEGKTQEVNDPKAPSTAEEAEGKEEKTVLAFDENTPQVLRRCSKGLLSVMAPQLRQEYVRAWTHLHKLERNIMATAIQAAMRGHASRSQANMARILIEVQRSGLTGAPSGGGDSAKIKALEEALRAERAKEAALEDELAAEKEAEMKLKQQLTRLKLRAVDKHLEKAADEATAKQMLLQDKEEHKAAQEQLQQERRRISRKGSARIKKRRFRHVLAALRGAVGGRTDAEIVALLDTNGDGLIHEKELWAVMQTLSLQSGHAINEDDARSIFEEFDQDKDGVCEVHEMLSAIREPGRNFLVTVGHLSRGLQKSVSNAV